MNLIIDNREKDIKKYFNLFPKTNFENLDLGDIRFEYNSNLILLIERKTLSDLSQSIKSGRYKEQKIRLLNSNYDNSRIMYLIEGNSNNKNLNIEGLPFSTLFGSIINTIIRDNLKVYRTSNLEETIYFIESIYNKLFKNKIDLTFLDINKKNDRVSNTNDNSSTTYLNNKYLQTIKTKKKENITPFNCYILQLSQIPGISTFLANQIADNYPVLKDLYNIYDLKKELALKDLTYKNNSGKYIKFGPKKSTLVYKFLYQKI